MTRRAICLSSPTLKQEEAFLACAQWALDRSTFNTATELKIVSIKSYTPPSSGDYFIHEDHGVVRLIKRGPGDEWICELECGKRLYLRPSKMKQKHEMS